MFCPKCGSENPDNAKFCGNCRHQFTAKFGGSDNDPVNEVVDIESKQRSEPVSDLMKYGILASTVIIPFIGVIMGIVYLVQGETENKKSVGKLWLIGGVVMMFIYLMISSEY